MVYEASGHRGYATNQKQLSSSHVLNVRSMNIPCTQNWAPAPKLGHLHLQQAKQSRARTLEVCLKCLRGGLLCGCAAVTSETRHPMLRTCRGFRSPHVWDRGRWAQAWDLCPSTLPSWAILLCETCLAVWQGMALEMMEFIYHLQTVFYRAQTRSQICRSNYKGKENWWHLIQCWSSVRLFSVVNCTGLGSHGKSRTDARGSVV